MKHFWLVATLVLALGVVYKIAYPTYSCRYRMTVSVEVDGQIRSASAVNEVGVTMLPVIFHENVSFRIDERGEAVFLDLGDGRNLVALLATGTVAEKTGFGHQIFEHFHLNPAERRDAGKLSSLRGSWDVSSGDLPTLVTFADPKRSETIQVSPPHQLESRFGPNVHWRGVRIEMTTDPLSREIESKLPWVREATSGLMGQTITGEPGRFTFNGAYFRRTWSWL